MIADQEVEMFTMMQILVSLCICLMVLLATLHYNIATQLEEGKR